MSSLEIFINLIQSAAVLIAAAALFINAGQFSLNRKQAKFKIVMDIYTELNKSSENKEIFYMLEYEQFKYADIHNTEKGKQLDCL
jgi:hypothetical protein